MKDSKFKPMVFEITPECVEVLNEWMGYIYSKHGNYGKYEYKFKDDVIWVYNDLEKSEICLNKNNNEL